MESIKCSGNCNFDRWYRLTYNPSRNTGLSGAHPGINPLKSRLIRENLVPGPVLDVGCGNGLYGLKCQDICKDITQLDVTDRRDDKARHLPFVEANVEAHDFPANAFSNIIAFDIIEHLDDDSAFLLKSFKWLRRGGRIFISVPNEDNSMLEPLNLSHVHFTDKTHRREYSQEKFKCLLDSTGFNVLALLPHFNTAIAGVPLLLAKNNPVSKVLAKLCSYQMHVLM